LRPQQGFQSALRRVDPAGGVVLILLDVDCYTRCAEHTVWPRIHLGQSVARADGSPPRTSLASDPANTLHLVSLHQCPTRRRCDMTFAALEWRPLALEQSECRSTAPKQQLGRQLLKETWQAAWRASGTYRTSPYTPLSPPQCQLRMPIPNFAYTNTNLRMRKVPYFRMAGFASLSPWGDPRGDEPRDRSTPGRNEERAMI